MYAFTITEITAEDSGKYRCNIHNSAGSQEALVRLTVQDRESSDMCPGAPENMTQSSPLWINLQKPSGGGGGSGTRDGRTKERQPPAVENGPQITHLYRPEHPAFSRPLRDCSVQEGSDITLEGQVTGTPPISVSWLHNGEPLRFGKSTFQAGVARLVVDECLPEDAGVYTCVLGNCGGKTSSTAAVTVDDVGRLAHSKTPQVSHVMVSSNVKTVSTSPAVSQITITPNGTAEMEKGAVTMLFQVLPQHGITREVYIPRGPLSSLHAGHTNGREKTRNPPCSRMSMTKTTPSVTFNDCHITENHTTISSPVSRQGIGRTQNISRSEGPFAAIPRAVKKAEVVLTSLFTEHPQDASVTIVPSATLISEKGTTNSALIPEIMKITSNGVTQRRECAPEPTTTMHPKDGSARGIITEKNAAVSTHFSSSYSPGARTERTCSTATHTPRNVTFKEDPILGLLAGVQAPERNKCSVSEKAEKVPLSSTAISGSAASTERTHSAAQRDRTVSAHNHVKENGINTPLAPERSKAGISEANGGASILPTVPTGYGRAKKQHVILLDMPTTAKKCPEMASPILAISADVRTQDCSDGRESEEAIQDLRPSSTSLMTDRLVASNALPLEVMSAGTNGSTEAAKPSTPTQFEDQEPEEAIADDDLVHLSPISACGSPESVTPKRRALKSADSLKLLDPINCVEVKAGDQAELYCGILGSPPIAASWVKQKKQISSGTKTLVETTDTGSKLVIQDVQADDSGCYTLFVRDRTGSIQHQISLSVTDRPQPPSGKPYASALQAETLTLSWSGPCYDGGSAIQHYVVEVKEVGETTWRTLTDSCLSTSYRVKSGLEPQHEYQFRVRAVNTHGISEPGDESTVIKMSTDEDTGSIEPFEYQQVVINTTDKVSDLYIQLEKLGVGKFGQVYRLEEKSSGKNFAGKFYRTRTTKEKENARMEVELMNKLHHPKLAQCVVAYQSRAEMVMVLEYIAGGELFERIVDDAFEHTEPTCVQYVQQILEGVQYMHEQNIVHLDLKPENIICVNRTGNHIKIIDFGLARMLDLKTQVKVMQGTPEFIAPEVIAFEPIGFTTDMWSIGVICYILLSGDSPFQGNNDMETLRNVTAAQWDFEDDTFEEISDRAKDFISKLLKKSMRSRLTADQALEHPWLKETELGSTKTLPKEKIKKFLARQKWQKTGKAVLALKRMSLLSHKQDNKVTSPDSPHRDDIGCSPEDNEVFSFLHQQIQTSPSFSKTMKDQVEVEGSSACLQCHIEGYPDPEVLWFQNGIPVQECGRFRIDYDETGSCSLIISDVSEGDSGHYACKAFNDMGEAEISAKLTVCPLHAARNR